MSDISKRPHIRRSVMIVLLVTMIVLAVAFIFASRAYSDRADRTAFADAEKEMLNILETSSRESSAQATYNFTKRCEYVSPEKLAPKQLYCDLVLDAEYPTKDRPVEETIAKIKVSVDASPFGPLQRAVYDDESSDIVYKAGASKIKVLHDLSCATELYYAGDDGKITIGVSCNKQVRKAIYK